MSERSSRIADLRKEHRRAMECYGQAWHNDREGIGGNYGERGELLDQAADRVFGVTLMLAAMLVLEGISFKEFAAETMLQAHISHCKKCRRLEYCAQREKLAGVDQKEKTTCEK